MAHSVIYPGYKQGGIMTICQMKREEDNLGGFKGEQISSSQ